MGDETIMVVTSIKESIDCLTIEFVFVPVQFGVVNNKVGII